jgi:outer membrane protein assembly factor BamB
MQNSKSKILTISMILILTISMSTILIENAAAHDPPQKITTHAYVQAVINPVGVGQSTYIYMWVDKVKDGALITNNVRFHNYKLTITAPNGDVTEKTFETVTDSTSNQAYAFTPNQVGTYNLTFNFPEQVHEITGSAYDNDTYLASSYTTTLTVQADPIGTFPASPLPTEYWTRPIDGQNPEWYTISSNWLGAWAPGYYNVAGSIAGAWPVDDAVGPQTSHVMWTKVFQTGGIVGGNNTLYPGGSYFEGSAYNTRFWDPIIINGKLYYSEAFSFQGGANGPTVCVDLQTGQTIWRRTDVPNPTFGYIYDVQDPNQRGAYPPILISGGGLFPFGPSTWRAFDAETGNALFNITNVPSGTSVIGPQGEVLIYVLSNLGTSSDPQYYLARWNSSRLWTGQYSGASTTPSIVPPITDGSNPLLYDWNVSIPSLNSETKTPTILQAYDNMLICMNGTFPAAGNNILSPPSSSPYTYFAVNVNSASGSIGNVLWRNTLNPPEGNVTVLFSGGDPTVGVFAEYYQETFKFVGYSMTTGQKLWTTSGDEAALAFYSTGYIGMGPQMAYGKLYSGPAYTGLLYCYDLTNGNLLWTYGNGGPGNSTNSGFEAPGNYPTVVTAIGNGIIYTSTSEHQVSTPIYKGALVRAINATTGEEIWTLANDNNGAYLSWAMADGYAATFNGYDNQVYCIGRGPSATTVSAPDVAVQAGTTVVIKGTVTDVAAGTKQTEQAGKFPNGVPVASDAIMKDWMGYVYQDQVRPTNFTGVPVTISVVDPNGNYQVIGTTKTTISGTYSLSWKTPDVAGTYQVTATFAGTNAYYPSYSQNAFAVDEAAPTATPQPTQPPSAADLYFLPMSIAIIIVMVVIGAVIVLLQKKHP